MQKIKIGFSRPTKMTFKPYAWIIMKAYGTEYDHVYIRLPSSTLGKEIIFQASGKSVNFMATELFDSNNLVIREFEVETSDENYSALLKFAAENSGKPYGIKEAIGDGIVKICALVGKKISNPFSDKNDSWVCSELAGYCLEQFAGASITPEQDDITPPDVYDYLLSAELPGSVNSQAGD
jgi:hypothetical protein